METNFDKRVVENHVCDVCDVESVQLCTMVKAGMRAIFYCRSCWEKDIATMAAHQAAATEILTIPSQNHSSRTTPTALPGPIAINSVLKESADIDSKVEVRADLFNAETKSIIELKAAIDADATITNKAYALAETLVNRFTHHKTVVFELNQKLIEEGNKQKAIQIYLNTMANQLRAEEREKLKINDLNYKPAPPKAVKVKPVATTTTKKKIDKKELREAAGRLGVSEFTLQMIVVQKGITVADAEKMLAASINAAKG